MKTRLDIHDRIIGSLANIGASDEQLNRADEMWKKGICVTYHRGLKHALEGGEYPQQHISYRSKEVIAISEEFEKTMMDFDNWQVASPEKIETFMREKGVLNGWAETLLQGFFPIKITL